MEYRATHQKQMFGIKRYNSDIGNRGARVNGKTVKQIPVQLLSPDESGETVPPHVQEVAMSRGARLIIRTFRYGKKPGAWYIKGDYDTDYDAVEQCVISNQERFARRRCWILPEYSTTKTKTVTKTKDITTTTTITTTITPTTTTTTTTITTTTTKTKTKTTTKTKTETTTTTTTKTSDN